MADYFERSETFRTAHVYLTVTVGLVIEERWEYGQDKANVYVYFDESIWQDKQKIPGPAQGNLQIMLHEWCSLDTK